MKRPFIVVFLLALIVVSCDNDFPDDYCTCHEGGNAIEGWDDVQDTTLVNKKDTLGGFDVTVDGWNNSDKQDIFVK